MTEDHTMTIEDRIKEMAVKARKASWEMAKCPTAVKNAVLLKIAALLSENAEDIKLVNEKDLEYAREKGLSSAMIDRLTIKDTTIQSMITGLKEIVDLEDPVGAVTETRKRPNGLQVSKVRIPLGVIGIIYESRPNVTIDAAALCLKAGNAVILRGGSEALNSNRILAGIISKAFMEAGLSGDAVQVIPIRDREAINIMLAQDEHIDLIIPRGGEGLIRFVTQNSKIPVLKHYKGVCHVYIDDGCNQEMAYDIVRNAKVQRPGVCNALETLLVHKKVSYAFLPMMAKRLAEEGVTLRGCPETCKIIPQAEAADEADWHAEYLDLILAVKIVSNMDEAVKHIAEYGSDHTEAIITNSYDRARRFVSEVNSSVVLVNASTRFNDGGQLGLGAEIGISTTKLHAFGPMGVDELTTQKYVVFGSGQVRD